MTDINLLKSEYVKRGLTQKEFCRLIKMPYSTFARRIRSGVFKSEEAERIIGVLGLKEPEKIFFAKQIT